MAISITSVLMVPPPFILGSSGGGAAAPVFGGKFPQQHWERLKPFRVDLDALEKRKRKDEEEIIALLS